MKRSTTSSQYMGIFSEVIIEQQINIKFSSVCVSSKKYIYKKFGKGKCLGRLMMYIKKKSRGHEGLWRDGGESVQVLAYTWA